MTKTGKIKEICYVKILKSDISSLFFVHSLISIPNSSSPLNHPLLRLVQKNLHTLLGNRDQKYCIRLEQTFIQPIPSPDQNARRTSTHGPHMQQLLIPMHHRIPGALTNTIQLLGQQLLCIQLCKRSLICILHSSGHRNSNHTAEQLHDIIVNWSTHWKVGHLS